MANLSMVRGPVVSSKRTAYATRSPVCDDVVACDARARCARARARSLARRRTNGRAHFRRDAPRDGYRGDAPGLRDNDAAAARRAARGEVLRDLCS